MKKPFLLLLPAALGLLTQCQSGKPAATATAPTTPAPAAAEAPRPKEYKYTTVAGDPLKTRIYTLDNGLTVYLSDYDDAPRIQTYVAVRAGSKNDPHDATGLAHYLEHMVFKGTSRLGAQDFNAEQAELAKIEALYEQYRGTRDAALRKRLYHQIDSVSGVAARYAVANEYDKLMGAIGAKGSNAYTSVEQTVYLEDIPSNRVEQWASVQAERFGELVPRLFHTELEAVYEEKNRGLDNDFSKEFEALNRSLYRKHEYGTQTTIGTIEHLQNPSITAIKAYFDRYYVPNNMAVAMSGDLDFDQTIRTIDQYFGKLKNKPVPAFTPAQEDPLTAPVVTEVKGPQSENVMVGFRFPGTTTKDALVLRMIDKILTNGQAGLIDLNLNQKQLVLEAQSFTEINNDYSSHVLYGTPRQGQTLDQVRDLLLTQLEKVKKGDFPEWLIPAIINNEQLQRTRSYESNEARAGAFVAAFVARQDWKDFLQQFEDFGKITKADVMRVAQQYYGPGYALIYKRTGKDSSTPKVIKPAITPVPVNRDASSEYYKQVVALQAPELQPVFLDYKKDIEQNMVQTGLPLFYTKNTENNLFSLYYVLDMGTNNDPKLGLAADYLKYLGTGKYSAAQLQQEFYKLGCSFDVSSSPDRVFVSLSGLDKNMEPALQLFEQLLSNPTPDPQALKDMVAGVLKNRQDAKLNKGVILSQAMLNYVKYGPRNPFTNIVSEKELKALKPQELISRIKQLETYQHRVLYYGPRPLQSVAEKKEGSIDAASGFAHINTTSGTLGVVDIIRYLHGASASKLSSTERAHNIRTGFYKENPLTPTPAAKDFAELPLKDRRVYWTDFNMVQAEILFLSRGDAYDKALVPTVSLYNEYFGGNMGSIVFQELRESKALAYSATSRYNNADKTGRSNYQLSYIGTQADKLPEAMAGMETLLNDMPMAEANLTIARQSIRNSIATERITKSDVLFAYERAKRLGLDYDLRRDIYEQTANMSLSDLKKFQEARVKGRPQTVLVIGSKDRLNFKELAKYGQVQQLTLKEIFGY